MADFIHSQKTTKDGIQWHYQRTGTGPDLVLIPSGEGDCESFAKTANALATSFTVTTFDMPGMSRTLAPHSAMENITATKLALQILGLLDDLSIHKASFWGCSSGGLVAFTLASEHPDRVRNVIVHEVPLDVPDAMLSLKSMDDAAIVTTCQHVFGRVMCEDEDKWNSLGSAYHQRLEKNYVTWVRTYLTEFERHFSNEELSKRPVRWTIGSMTPPGLFDQNVKDGSAAGIRVDSLPSRHFPQVTIPDLLAEHIRLAVVEHL